MAKEHGMIEPFADGQVRAAEDGSRVISYGVSSYGYDLRVTNEFKVFTNVFNSIVDPKGFAEDSFVNVTTDECIVPPNSFALARSVEYFRIPRNVLTVCLGKSTYARCGIIVNVTPFEPEWEGHVTLKFPTRPRCPPKSTPTKALRRSSFLRPKKFARPATPTAAANTKAKPASPSRGCNHADPRTHPGADKDSKWLMVVLHGLGDSMEGYRWLPTGLNVPWLNYLLVNAPDDYHGGFSWYDIFENPAPGVERSRAALMELLDASRKRAFRRNRFFNSASAKAA